MVFMTMQEANLLVGRIVWKEGINYTVTQATSPEGYIYVWNPAEQRLTVFDSLELFENWAYRKPIAAAAPATKEG